MARKEAATGEKETPGPEYIMLIGNLPNGVVLAGFENAEVYPGEPVKVRGDDGLNVEHAVKLVNTGRFIWCDENGTPKPDDFLPKVTEEEAAAINATGGANLPGGPTTYPAFHREDRSYTGPSELPAPEVPDEQPDVNPDDFQQPAALSIKRTATERREQVSEGPATVGGVDVTDPEPGDGE